MCVCRGVKFNHMVVDCFTFHVYDSISAMCATPCSASHSNSALTPQQPYLRQGFLTACIAKQCTEWVLWRQIIRKLHMENAVIALTPVVAPLQAHRVQEGPALQRQLRA